jgi:hypothetical protein
MQATPRWFVCGDIDGFFGLALDNLIQILLIVGLCQGVLGFSTNLIYGRVLPGIALSLDDDLHWPSWVESIGSTHWLFDAQRGNHGSALSEWHHRFDCLLCDIWHLSMPIGRRKISVVKKSDRLHQRANKVRPVRQDSLLF